MKPSMGSAQAFSIAMRSFAAAVVSRAARIDGLFKRSSSIRAGRVSPDEVAILTEGAGISPEYRMSAVNEITRILMNMQNNFIEDCS